MFGRGPECHIRPNSELVSRQHCLLKVQLNGHMSIRDLGSANGTLVNGARLIGERILEDGDTLQVGQVVLQVIRTADADPKIAETAEINLDQTSGEIPTRGP